MTGLGRWILTCLLVSAAVAQAREGSPIPTRFAQTIDIAPRRQWNGNDGYCGETSFISAGMYFGQYCSQFTARSIASPGVPQSNEDSQLLLGVNEIAAADRMRLEAVPFYRDTQRAVPEFLSWVKSNFVRGHVVIIGVYNNVRALEESPPGFSTYDHIVPILSFGSNTDLEDGADRSRPSDVITLSDNGLYGPVGEPPVYPMLYSYRLRDFPKTRAAANRRNGPVYALRNRPENYGVAITGIVDLDGVTIPVRLTSDRDGEPDIVNGSDVPPAPVPMTLTATVQIPDQRVAYNLYRYDDFAKVPASAFNASATRAAQSWVIPAQSGATFVVTIATQSDATVILRAVPQSAP
jgi:hypothetical protein